MIKKLLGVLICFGIFYYMLVFQLFFNHKDNAVYPVLRDRFGTIMWHSSDVSKIEEGDLTGEVHTYCYYPGNQAQYPGRSGEYIIRKVSSFNDCGGFYGIVQFREGPWVSEIEKIWWNGDRV